MNQTNMRRGALAVLVVTGLTLAVVPGAVAMELATASHYGGGIDLRPSVRYSSAVLTVTGGDSVQRMVFGAGEMPTLGVYDAEGQLLPDGIYTWQLELVPDKATARALRVAATHNGGRAPNAWLPQSGSFAIVGGSIVGPGLVEPGQEAELEAGPSTLESLGSSRGSQGDDDAAVGMREGVEAAVRAAESGQRAARGVAPTPSGTSYRSDAATAAQGVSAESVLAPQARPVSPSVLTRPRSDGSHGRKKDQ